MKTRLGHVMPVNIQVYAVRERMMSVIVEALTNDQLAHSTSNQNRRMNLRHLILHPMVAET